MNEEILMKSIETLRDLKDIQCSDGNWNYDPYMHGMANGLIVALSLFEEGRVDFLNPPETWLKDKPTSEIKLTKVEVADTNSMELKL